MYSEENRKELDSSKIVDSVLATVNGDPITLLDVLVECDGNERVILLMNAAGGERDKSLLEMRRKILNNIIDRHLVWKDYSQFNYEFPIQLVEDTLTRISKEFADGSRRGLSEKLKSSGMTLQQLREKTRQRVAVDLMLNEKCIRPVVATPREIDRYYRMNLSEFQIPAKRDLSLILILPCNGKNKEVSETIKMIQNVLEKEPQKFAEMAKLYSDGPAAENGGSLGVIEDSKMRKEFADHLFNLPLGEKIVGPIETMDGVFFLKVNTLSEAQIRSFDDVREAIREIIELPQRKAREAKYLGSLRQKAVIRDFTGFLESDEKILNDEKENLREEISPKN